MLAVSATKKGKRAIKSTLITSNSTMLTGLLIAILVLTRSAVTKINMGRREILLSSITITNTNTSTNKVYTGTNQMPARKEYINGFTQNDLIYLSKLYGALVQNST